MAQETASARRDGSVAQAGVDVSVATARANAGETYGLGLAAATRDWQQSDAWNKRHAVWGNSDTPPPPNTTSWNVAVPGAETAYFNATAQAARDEVTWWGTAYLAQVDRESAAGTLNEQHSAEAVRVRGNSAEGYEAAFDLVWSNALNTQVQAAMFSSAGAGAPLVPHSPWHEYLGAVTLADHGLVTGTRSDELTLATARNDAEQVYQSSVSSARATLLHDRAQQEIGKAHDQAEDDITTSQTKFTTREATSAPDSLESSPGFAEGFPSRPRRPAAAVDFTNSGMPMVPTSYAEPPGFGLYEEGAEKPWGDLINPPSTLGSSTPTAPTTPWFAQGC